MFFALILVCEGAIAMCDAAGTLVWSERSGPIFATEESCFDASRLRVQEARIPLRDDTDYTVTVTCQVG